MESQQQFLQRQVEEWADFITVRLLREINKQKKMTVSKQEIYNVRNAVKLAATQYGAEIGFQFADAGRYIDMKLTRVRGSGDPQAGKELIEKLTDWVGRKGIQNFKYVPGNREGVFPIDQEKAIKRIALGIFFNRAAGNATHKRKKWWSHVVYGGLGNLYGKLMYGYGTQAVETLKKSIK